MDNGEVSTLLRGIADLLVKRKDPWFKVRAYRAAADAIDALDEPVERLVSERRLRQVPGVGEAINRKITELVTSGRLEYYERLKAEFPEGSE